MLKSFEASGKSVDEAIDKACLLAGRTIEELDIEILDLGGKGFFGFGGRDARVRVSYELPEGPRPAAGKDAGAAAASTYGVKMSKKERFAQKSAKTKAEIDIKPIVTVDPAAGLPEELKEASRQQPRPKREGGDNRDRGDSRVRSDNRDRSDSRVRSDSQDRSDSRGRSDSQERSDSRGRVDSRERRQDNRERSGGFQPRPNREDRAAADRGESKQPRKESRAADVTAGEMEQLITAAAMAFLQPLFDDLGVKPQVRSEVREGILWLSFSGESLGILIGRRGETLNSLQYLCNLAVNKHRGDHVRLVLDVEQYRQGREETLSVLAHKMADKAVKTGRRVELEPMNPHERRVVHIALQNDRRVDTVSHGEEPYRRVVISKRRHDKKPPRKEGGNHGGGRPAIAYAQTEREE